jgi:hypothetical protein
MAGRFVVGLFSGYGLALDAYHRLHTEGFPETRLAYQILVEGGPVPPTVGVEVPLLQIDPTVLEDVVRDFAPYLRSGETAVFVQVEDDEAEAATGILMLYTPLAVETLISDGGGGQ